jgi:ribose 5-phosphate isomerase A
MSTKDEFKRNAAYHAADFVESGMVIGLGSGSTAKLAVERIGELLAGGRLENIVGIPTSLQTETHARKLGIPVGGFEDHRKIDITIDGADEADERLNLIKGGGGALLREKIVAESSRRVIIALDDTKLSPALGMKCPLPVEVIPFGWQQLVPYLESLGARVSIRKLKNGDYFMTDQRNMVLDCRFDEIPNPSHLATELKQRTGIVEHGLFTKQASDLIVAGEEGIRHLTRHNEHN